MPAILVHGQQQTYVFHTGEIEVSGITNNHNWKMKTDSVDFRAQVMLLNRQLKTINSLSFAVPVKKLTSPNTYMDRIAHKTLKAYPFDKIYFKYIRAEISPWDDKDQYMVKATGNLTIAGITQAITMNLISTVINDGTLTFSGSHKLKLSTYQVTPKKTLMGSLKTSDDVTINFIIGVSSDYLVVNIPEFKLHVYHSGNLLWSCNVVVGQSVHKTVVFSGELKYVVFSPYWNVPSSIVRNEILPAMRKDGNYISRHNMEITGYRDGLPEIRQKPGFRNSLGLVKFLFPNSYNIYLHDTPAKSLFDESSRAFSHGCIRISEPFKLAEFLLRNDLSWNTEKISTAMNTGKEKHITLKDKMSVFIAYFTAFVDRNDRINFRKDIYGRDERLAEMILKEK